jgi:hypothetical protein
MPGLRDHSIFKVEFTKLEVERIEDSNGELTGARYTTPRRGEKQFVNIVAPNAAMAAAWVDTRWRADGVQIINISGVKLDAFIEEHTM